MKVETREIVVDDATVVSSEWARDPEYNGGPALLIAHGAGNDMHSAFLSFIHRRAAERGLLAVKFNFPYKERGGKIPDRAPRLIETWRRVVAAVRDAEGPGLSRLFLSGKSLGGRMASMLVAEGLGVDGLIFFGYPLHPPGQREKLRAAHFSDIDCPALFIQGTRDPLCDLSLLREHVVDKDPLHRTLRIVEGGDHSFKVLKKLGRTENTVWQEIADGALDWIAEAAAP